MHSTVNRRQWAVGLGASLALVAGALVALQAWLGQGNAFVVAVGLRHGLGLAACIGAHLLVDLALFCAIAWPTLLGGGT